MAPPPARRECLLGDPQHRRFEVDVAREGQEVNILIAQSNVGVSYHTVGRLEEAQSIYRDVYSAHLKLYGEKNGDTLRAASNLANMLVNLHRFEEAKSLLRKTIPLMRRVLEESDALNFRMELNYAEALYANPVATLDDLREAVTILEDSAPTARRVLGGQHPLVAAIEGDLRAAQALLRARSAAPSSP